MIRKSKLVPEMIETCYLIIQTKQKNINNIFHSRQ